MYSCSHRACDGCQPLRPDSAKLRGIREAHADVDEGDDGRAEGRRHNELKCGTWDPFTVCTLIQDAAGQVPKTRKIRGWAGWRLVSGEDKTMLEMIVMVKGQKQEWPR